MTNEKYPIEGSVEIEFMPRGYSTPREYRINSQDRWAVLSGNLDKLARAYDLTKKREVRSKYILSQISNYLKKLSRDRATSTGWLNPERFDRESARELARLGVNLDEPRSLEEC